MNPQEISNLLMDAVAGPSQDIDFVGFPDPNRVSTSYDNTVNIVFVDFHTYELQYLIDPSRRPFSILKCILIGLVCKWDIFGNASTI